jgi:hypothetical protein
MKPEWFYASDGRQHGPILATDLKELVQQGKILQSDLVWKEGMKNWKQAATIKGLFPDSSSVSPPPSHGDKVAVCKATTWISRLTTTSRAAGRLIAAQAERTKLVNIDLSAVYRDLGRYLHQNSDDLDEFQEQTKRICELKRKIDEIRRSVDSASTKVNVSDKIKGIAASTKATADRMLLEQKLRQAYGDLGQAAYGDSKAGPEELVAKLSELRSRLQLLDADINKLSQAPAGEMMTPKRIAMTGGLALAILALACITWTATSRGGYTETAKTALQKSMTHKTIDGEPISPEIFREIRSRLLSTSPFSRRDFLQALWILDDYRFSSGMTRLAYTSLYESDGSRESEWELVIPFETLNSVFGHPDELYPNGDFGFNFDKCYFDGEAVYHCTDGHVGLYLNMRPNWGKHGFVKIWKVETQE